MKQLLADLRYALRQLRRSLGGRLGRIREEIDRTIKEMRIGSRIM